MAQEAEQKRLDEEQARIMAEEEAKRAELERIRLAEEAE